MNGIETPLAADLWPFGKREDLEPVYLYRLYRLLVGPTVWSNQVRHTYQLRPLKPSIIIHHHSSLEEKTVNPAIIMDHHPSLEHSSENNIRIARFEQLAAAWTANGRCHAFVAGLCFLWGFGSSMIPSFFFAACPRLFACCLK